MSNKKNSYRRDRRDDDWSQRPVGTKLTGSRIYVSRDKASVRQVKMAIGKLAKKVRLSGRGDVEIIHTGYGWSHSTATKIRMILEERGWL